MTDYSNFITPPDQIEESDNHTVLLIDVGQTHVQQLAHWCQYANQTYDVYLYNFTMNDSDWLARQANKVDAIIMDPGTSPISTFKDTLKEHTNVWIYGSMADCPTWHTVDSPINYFINLEENKT